MAKSKGHKTDCNCSYCLCDIRHTKITITRETLEGFVFVACVCVVIPTIVVIHQGTLSFKKMDTIAERVHQIDASTNRRLDVIERRLTDLYELMVLSRNNTSSKSESLDMERLSDAMGRAFQAMGSALMSRNNSNAARQNDAEHEELLYMQGRDGWVRDLAGDARLKRTKETVIQQDATGGNAWYITQAEEDGNLYVWKRDLREEEALNQPRKKAMRAAASVF
jgi:hypothetical protein